MKFLTNICHLFYGLFLVLFVNDPENTRIESFMALILLLLFFFNNIFKKKYIKIPKALIPFLIFIFLSFFGIILNGAFVSFNIILLLIQLFIFMIILYNQFLLIDDFYFLFYGIFIGLLINIYIGTYISTSYFEETTKRYAGSLLNPNHYSFLLSSSLAILIYLFFKINNKFRFTLITLMLILVYEIIFKTGSRQGFLCVFLCLIFFLYKQNSNRNYSKTLFTLVISFFLINLFLNELSNFEYAQERVLSIFSFDTNNDISIDQRYGYLVQAFQYWIENPIFGVGIDQFRVLNNSSYSHNNYVELLGTTGITGFISFYYCHFIILKSFFLSKKNQPYFIYSIFFLTIILLSDISQVSYAEKPYWVIFTFAMFIVSKNNSKLNYTIKF